MGPPTLQTLPAHSPLTSFIASNTPSTLIHSPHHHALALQIMHNLQYQHDWTSLQIHTHSPLSLADSPALLLPRPLISGLPPSRVYIHPDEQVEMLKLGLGEKDVGREREWVLPAHLKEKWTLRGFAGVFDAIGKIPPEDGEGEEGNKEGESGGEEGKEGVGSRRGGKRVLLAIVGEDSTIVYYIVHDGIVKPRQN